MYSNLRAIDMNVVLTDEGQELTCGDVWKVTISGDVKTMKIMELSFHTVQLMEMPFSYIKKDYEIKRISFIERVA